MQHRIPIYIVPLEYPLLAVLIGEELCRAPSRTRDGVGDARPTAFAQQGVHWIRPLIVAPMLASHPLPYPRLNEEPWRSPNPRYPITYPLRKDRKEDIRKSGESRQRKTSPRRYVT